MRGNRSQAGAGVRAARARTRPRVTRRSPSCSRPTRCSRPASSSEAVALYKKIAGRQRRHARPRSRASAPAGRLSKPRRGGTGNAARAAHRSDQSVALRWRAKFSPMPIIARARPRKRSPTIPGLAADKDAPRRLRQRAEAMATFLKGGGDNDFGTVPHDAPPPTPDASLKAPRRASMSRLRSAYRCLALPLALVGVRYAATPAAAMRSASSDWFIRPARNPT